MDIVVRLAGEGVSFIEIASRVVREGGGYHCRDCAAGKDCYTYGELIEFCERPENLDKYELAKRRRQEFEREAVSASIRQALMVTAADFFGPMGAIRAVDEWSPAMKAAVESLKMDKMGTGRIQEFRLHPRTTLLKMLSERSGAAAPKVRPVADSGGGVGLEDILEGVGE